MNGVCCCYDHIYPILCGISNKCDKNKYNDIKITEQNKISYQYAQ